MELVDETTRHGELAPGVLLGWENFSAWVHYWGKETRFSQNTSKPVGSPWNPQTKVGNNTLVILHVHVILFGWNFSFDLKIGSIATAQPVV